MVEEYALDMLEELEKMREEKKEASKRSAYFAGFRSSLAFLVYPQGENEPLDVSILYETGEDIVRLLRLRDEENWEALFGKEAFSFEGERLLRFEDIDRAEFLGVRMRGESENGASFAAEGYGRKIASFHPPS